VTQNAEPAIPEASFATVPKPPCWVWYAVFEAEGAVFILDVRPVPKSFLEADR
jgi:hypothetical protein